MRSRRPSPRTGSDAGPPEPVPGPPLDRSPPALERGAPRPRRSAARQWRAGRNRAAQGSRSARRARTDRGSTRPRRRRSMPRRSAPTSAVEACRACGCRPTRAPPSVCRRPADPARTWSPGRLLPPRAMHARHRSRQWWRSWPGAPETRPRTIIVRTDDGQMGHGRRSSRYCRRSSARTAVKSTIRPRICR